VIYGAYISHEEGFNAGEICVEKSYLREAPTKGRSEK
jgi:hypothetical protein